MAVASRIEHDVAYSFWIHCVSAFSFWMQLCQGIFLLNTAVLGQMVSGRCVSWHHGYAGCQGTEHCSKYLGHIHKHPVGSRYRNSVQFYSLYLIYIYLCYFTFPAQAPSITPIAAIITCSNPVLMRIALLSMLETNESWQIRHNTMSTTR